MLLRGAFLLSSSSAEQEEVLAEQSYISLVRMAFLARLVSLVLGALAVPPDNGWARVLVLALGIVSLACSRGDMLIRILIRHPLLGMADCILMVSVVLIIGVDSPLAFSSVCSGLIVGLLYRRRYAWPLLVILVAGNLGAANALLHGDPRSRLLVMAGAPVLEIGVAAVGGAARRGFQESHTARKEAAAALAVAHAADERARLARDMHDSLGKTLHGLGLAAASLPGMLQRDPHRASSLAAALADAASRAAQEARVILLDLRRGQLDRPLAEVLGDYCREWSAENGIPVAFEARGTVDTGPATAEELYAVAKEALHNVAKHARATNVRVTLGGEPDDVRLVVVDDGVGLDPARVARAENEGHFGLRGLRERAEQARGRLALSSATNEGTTVTWTAPRA